MNKKENPCEAALAQFRGELRNAILNEKIEMKFIPATTEGYYAELHMRVGDAKFYFALADKFIYYHNVLLEDLFPRDSDDFAKLTVLAKKYVKRLTPDEENRIKQLYDEIDRIRLGKEES